jgi:hypothetical protein
MNGDVHSEKIHPVPLPLKLRVRSLKVRIEVETWNPNPLLVEIFPRAKGFGFQVLKTTVGT